MGDFEAQLQGIDVIVIVREGIAHGIDEGLLGDRQRTGRGEHVTDPAERVGVGVTQVSAHATEIVAQREASVVVALVIDALPLVGEREQRAAQ